jgi:hypothetical protein
VNRSPVMLCQCTCRRWKGEQPGSEENNGNVWKGVARKEVALETEKLNAEPNPSRRRRRRRSRVEGGQRAKSGWRSSERDVSCRERKTDQGSLCRLSGTGAQRQMQHCRSRIDQASFSGGAAWLTKSAHWAAGPWLSEVATRGGCAGPDRVSPLGTRA